MKQHIDVLVAGYDLVKKFQEMYKDVKPAIDAALKYGRMTFDRDYRSEVNLGIAKKLRQDAIELNTFIEKYKQKLKNGTKHGDPELEKIVNEIVKRTKGWGGVVAGYDKTTHQPIIDVNSAERIETDMFGEWKDVLETILQDNDLDPKSAAVSTDREIEKKNHKLASLLNKQAQLKTMIAKHRTLVNSKKYTEAQKVVAEAQKKGLVSQNGSFLIAYQALQQEIDKLQTDLAKFANIDAAADLAQMNQEQFLGGNNQLKAPGPKVTGKIPQKSNKPANNSPRFDLQANSEFWNEINNILQKISDDIKEYFPKFVTQGDGDNPNKTTLSTQQTPNQSEADAINPITVLNETIINCNSTLNQLIEKLTSGRGQDHSNSASSSSNTEISGKPKNPDVGGNGQNKSGNSNSFFGDWRQTLKDSAQQMGDWSTNMQNVVANTAQSMYATMSNVFFDAFQGKIKSFKDYFTSFANSILQSLANALANSLVKSLINGMRADGGPVSGGNTYLVGERGPELFIPNSSGTIRPNHQLTVGSAAPQVTVNVINNSGQAVNARQESRFDGQRYVVDVWLDALSRNVGGLRDVVMAGR